MYNITKAVSDIGYERSKMGTECTGYEMKPCKFKTTKQFINYVTISDLLNLNDVVSLSTCQS